MEETVQILQTYGGWAVCFFLALAIVKLYKDFRRIIEEKEKTFQECIKSKDTTIQQQSNEHHKEIVAVVRECTAVLTTVSDVLNDYSQKVMNHE